eukprot:m51a1_g2159 hypothetical protein (211) ;mRNA; f:38405-39178
MSGQDSLRRLKELCMCELNAPEILPYDPDTVEYLKTRVKDALESAAAAEEAGGTEAEQVVARLCREEAERVRYWLVLYLRARLAKVAEWPAFLLSDEQSRPRMSPAEVAFAERACEIEETHLCKSFVSRLPEENSKLRALQGDDPASKLPLQPTPVFESEFVFVLVLEHIGQFHINERTSDTVELLEGDIVALRYKLIRPLLAARRVTLV